MYQQVKLDEVCVRKIETISSDENGLIDYFDIASVDNTKKKIISHQSLKVKEAPSRAKQIVQLNDILVSTVRPNLNAIAMIDNKTKNKMVASTGFCVLRASEKIEPRYLFYFVQSPTFINSMTAQATGASYPAVSNSIVKSSHIPLPDISTQRRIADTLDKVSEGIGLCRKMLGELDLMVKAKFGEMFGDPVSNPMGWEEKKLVQVCKKLTDGTHFSPESFATGAYKYVTAKNIRINGFDFSNITYIPEEVHRPIYERCNPEYGDVLYIKDGVTTGIAMVNTLHEEFSLLSSVALLKQDSNVINGYFLCGVLNNAEMYSNIRMNMGGAAITRLTIAKLNEIQVIVPPIELQEQFATFVSKSDKSRLTIQQVLSKMELEQKVLMQKYFG